MDVLKDFVRRFYSSGAVEACGHPDSSGTLGAEIRLLPYYDLANGDGVSKILVELHGSQSASSFAVCVHRGLDQLIETFDVPVKTTRAIFEDVGIWPVDSQARFRRFIRQ